MNEKTISDCCFILFWLHLMNSILLFHENFNQSFENEFKLLLFWGHKRSRYIFKNLFIFGNENEILLISIYVTRNNCKLIEGSLCVLQWNFTKLNLRYLFKCFGVDRIRFDKMYQLFGATTSIKSIQIHKKYLMKTKIQFSWLQNQTQSFATKFHKWVFFSPSCLLI